jgi:hypothetical protein
MGSNPGQHERAFDLRQMLQQRPDLYTTDEREVGASPTGGARPGSAAYTYENLPQGYDLNVNTGEFVPSSLVGTINGRPATQVIAEGALSQGVSPEDTRSRAVYNQMISDRSMAQRNPPPNENMIPTPVGPFSPADLAGKPRGNRPFYGSPELAGQTGGGVPGVTPQAKPPTIGFSFGGRPIGEVPVSLGLNVPSNERQDIRAAATPAPRPVAQGTPAPAPEGTPIPESTGPQYGTVRVANETRQPGLPNPAPPENVLPNFNAEQQAALEAQRRAEEEARRRAAEAAARQASR